MRSDDRLAGRRHRQTTVRGPPPPRGRQALSAHPPAPVDDTPRGSLEQRAENTSAPRPFPPEAFSDESAAFPGRHRCSKPCSLAVSSRKVLGPSSVPGRVDRWSSSPSDQTQSRALCAPRTLIRSVWPCSLSADDARASRASAAGPSPRSTVPTYWRSPHADLAREDAHRPNRPPAHPRELGPPPVARQRRSEARAVRGAPTRPANTALPIEARLPETAYDHPSVAVPA